MIKSLIITSEFSGCLRKNDALKQLIDFKNYPNLVPYIDSIRILETGSQNSRTEWFITLDGAPFSWVQLDTFLPEHYIIRYTAVNGDFDVFNGEYKIEDNPASNGIKITGSLNFELGIPVIEENCGEILKEKFLGYLAAVIQSHGNALQKDAIEERQFERVRINRRCVIEIDGRVVESKVLDFSRGGLSIAITRGMLGTGARSPARFRFATIEEQGFLSFDERYRIHRIQFGHPLDDAARRALWAELAKGDYVSDEQITICDVLTAPVNAPARSFAKKTVL
jgi:ribosome-associated toxin RatA of RatAB toxin-antitoxin module